MARTSTFVSPHKGFIEGSMEKHITKFNPEDLDLNFLKSVDWDIVEFQTTIDVELLEDYYNVLNTTYKHLEFHFKLKEYLLPEIYETYAKTGRVGNYEGDVSGWSASWPADRDVPCAGKRHVNPEKYPELLKYNLDAEADNFYSDSKIMELYKFGLVKKLLDTYSEKALRQLLVSRHGPGAQVHTHTDGSYKKLHIPMITNDDAYFVFGPNGERRYNMVPGKVYMINPSVPHGTINLGSTDRVHILSRIDPEFVPEFAKLHTNIE
jgi:hypothetical protein